jgi:hypothetical protein
MVYNVMIRCPVVDKSVPTGTVCDLRTFEALDRDMDCDCPACGQHHRWSIADAWLRDRHYVTAPDKTLVLRVMR